jgi:hypothetical protein
VKYLCMVSDDERRAVPVATTECVRRGRVSTTDGPFAETNEQIGGVYPRCGDRGDRPAITAGREPI